MATQAMFPVRSSLVLALLGWSAACGAAGQLDPDGQSSMEKEVARRAAVEPAMAAGWQMTRSVEAGVQVAGESNLFWKLSNTPARNPGFDFNPYWYEFYVKPALGFKRNLGDGRQLYARVSAVGSGTLRHDPFGAGDTGRISIEEFVAGIRMPLGGTRAMVDVSAGAQNFTLGTGMLIANGGSNGFDRGALKLGPRKAFQNSVVAKISQDAFSAQAFYLDPNENPDNDSGTRVVGVDVSYAPANDRKAGIAYGKVPRSHAAYPQAAPGGIGAPLAVPDGRKDLQFVYGYARVPVLPTVLSKGWFGVDAAREWNTREPMRAWGWRTEGGFSLPDVAWTPKFTLGYQSFSGDDPSTARNERFDPLFFEGTPGAWASGSKATWVFVNANVNALQATIELHPTPKDTVTAYLAQVRANQMGSPLQFGQATRLDVPGGAPVVIAGVLRPMLANDVFVKYVRVVNPNTYLTLGFSASFAQSGVNQLVNGQARTWTGWLANVVWVY